MFTFIKDNYIHSERQPFKIVSCQLQECVHYKSKYIKMQTPMIKKKKNKAKKIKHILKRSKCVPSLKRMKS